MHKLTQAFCVKVLSSKQSRFISITTSIDYSSNDLSSYSHLLFASKTFTRCAHISNSSLHRLFANEPPSTVDIVLYFY